MVGFPTPYIPQGFPEPPYPSQCDLLTPRPITFKHTLDLMEMTGCVVMPTTGDPLGRIRWVTTDGYTGLRTRFLCQVGGPPGARGSGCLLPPRGDAPRRDDLDDQPGVLRPRHGMTRFYFTATDLNPGHTTTHRNGSRKNRADKT